MSLRAVTMIDGLLLGVMRGRAGRRGRRPGGFGLLLLDPDFLLERVAQLVGRFLEFGEALAERLSQLRQLPRTKNDQSDHENDDQLGHADRTKHSVLPSRIRTRNQRSL